MRSVLEVTPVRWGSVIWLQEEDESENENENEMTVPL